MWRVASAKSDRYPAMTGLRLEPLPDGTLCAVACDGRMMLVADVADAKTEGFAGGTVPRGLLRVAENVVKKSRSRGSATCTFEGGTASLEFSTAEGPVRLTAATEEGRFPAWREVLAPLLARPALEPTDEQRQCVVPLRVGVQLLRALLESLEGMGMDNVDLFLPVSQQINSYPVLFRAVSNEGQQVYGCLITLSGTSQPPRVPSEREIIATPADGEQSPPADP